MNDKEKVVVYENLLHSLQGAMVAMNNERMHILLDSISAWSYAHRQGNGELYDEKQQELIDKAFNRIKDLV